LFSSVGFGAWHYDINSFFSFDAVRNPATRVGSSPASAMLYTTADSLVLQQQ
jgi:hypothetical protein